MANNDLYLGLSLAVAAWVALVALLRRRRAAAIASYAAPPSSACDWEKLHTTLAQVELPFDQERAMEIALLRTYAIPSISAVLTFTGVCVAGAGEGESYVIVKRKERAGRRGSLLLPSLFSLLCLRHALSLSAPLTLLLLSILLLSF